MKKNMVSLIVPIYNVEKYLSKCVESLLKQTYDNLEIILVNDGSADNSLNICKKYEKADDRVIVVNKKNGGVSSARNAGLDLAKGKYIAFIDGDDFLEPDFVEYMINLIQENNCDFAFSKNCFKYENDEQISNDNVIVLNSVDTTASILSLKLEVGCWNKLYKKDIIEKIRFDENQFYGEGLQFITTVAQLSPKTAVGQRKVYHYRQDNISSATKKYNYNKLVNGEKTLQLIEKKLIIHDKKIYNQLYAHCCMFYYNAICLTIKNNQVKEHISDLRNWKRKAKKNYLYLLMSSDINFKIKIRVFVLLYFTFIYKIKYS